MSIAAGLTHVIDLFYIKPLQKIMPLQTFRYAVCGGVPVLLNLLMYFVLYNFVLEKEGVINLGIVSISSYIAAFLITFPVTFLLGFWLQRNITFQFSPLRGRVQLFRYLVSVAGSLVLNYIFLKFFCGVLGIYPTPSQALSTLLTIVYSYFMQRNFTFRGFSTCK